MDRCSAGGNAAVMLNAAALWNWRPWYAVVSRTRAGRMTQYNCSTQSSVVSSFGKLLRTHCTSTN